MSYESNDEKIERLTNMVEAMVKHQHGVIDCLSFLADMQKNLGEQQLRFLQMLGIAGAIHLPALKVLENNAAFKNEAGRALFSTMISRLEAGSKLFAEQIACLDGELNKAKQSQAPLIPPLPPGL